MVCLKLQGFPDNYQLPSSMKWQEAKVYKMIGNSVSPRVSELLSKLVYDYLNENLNENKLAV